MYSLIVVHRHISYLGTGTRLVLILGPVVLQLLEVSNGSLVQTALVIQREGLGRRHRPTRLLRVSLLRVGSGMILSGRSIRVRGMV